MPSRTEVDEFSSNFCTVSLEAPLLVYNLATEIVSRSTTNSVSGNSSSCAITGSYSFCYRSCDPLGPGNDVCRDDASTTTGIYACVPLADGTGVCDTGCYAGSPAGLCDFMHCPSGFVCNSNHYCQ